MTIIGGDQLTLGVDFFIDGEPAEFGENTAELVIRIGQQEIIHEPQEYAGNTARFYLSGTETADLLNRKHDGKMSFSVRFYFGGNASQRETPIHDEDLTIVR